MLENILKKLGVGTLSTFLIFSSCEKEDLTPENQEPLESKKESTLYGNVLDITDKVPSILDYNEATGEINFSEASEIPEGYIIYSGITDKTPYGLLRYVNSVSYRGKKLTTRQAGLEETIKEGEGYCNGKLFYSDLISSSSNSLQLKKAQNKYEFHLDFNEIIYDQDNDFSTTEDQTILSGSADFDILYYTKLSVDDKKININFETKIEGETSASIESNLNFDLDKEINLWEANFKPITFVVGVVPVVIVPKIELNAYIDGDFESDISLKLQDDFEAEASLSYNSDWNFEKSFSNDFSHEINLESSLSAKLSVGPKFIGAFYNIAGPSFETNFYGELKADISENPWWTLNAGLEGKLGFDVGAITKIADVKDFKKTIFDYKKELANSGGPFAKENTPPIAEFNVSPNKGTTSTIFEFLAFSSRDLEDGFDIQCRWDWETDGKWDTEYSSEKIQQHQFAKTGYNTVTLEVKDSGGLTDTKMQWIQIDKEKEEKELIIQPGPEGKDAYVKLVVWSNGDKTYSGFGNESFLDVDRLYYGTSGQEEETLIQFPLESISSDTKINSAILELYGQGAFAQETAKINVSEITSSWNESDVKWDTKPSYGEKITISTLDDRLGWHQFDITSLVQEWIDGKTNYGVVIETSDHRPTGEGGFSSSDNPDKEKRPKLIIKYNE